MISRALFGLLLRPAVAVTLGILAALTGIIQFGEHALRDTPTPNGPVIFQIAYTGLAVAFLVSFGALVAKMTVEVEGIRLARTIPGFRHRMTAGILLLAPAVAFLALVFLLWAVPGQLRSLSFATQWCLGMLLFCWGLGRIWWLSALLVVVGSRSGGLLDYLRDAPLAATAGALGASCLMLKLWHARFLAPITDEGGRFKALIRPKPQTSDALARRTGEPLRDVRDWQGTAGDLTLFKLIKAGVYERLGHRFGMLLGSVGLSVVSIHGAFGFLLYALSAKSGEAGFFSFSRSVFTSGMPDRWIVVARIIFATITAMVTYMGALMLDTTLRPNLWHPVSRWQQGRAVFWSRLRQNGIYALVHVAVSFGLVAGIGVLAGKTPGLGVFRAFLMPAAVGFLLAPIPQALFPLGLDTFHATANPLVQLGAGLTGGLFCLLTVYWTSSWPTKQWHVVLSPLSLTVCFVGALFTVYGAYRAYVNFRHARVDLSRRAL